MLATPHTSCRIALFGAVLFANSLFADSARLANGDVISGKIMRLRDDALIVQTDYAGAVSIAETNVVEIILDSRTDIHAEDVKDGSFERQLLLVSAGIAAFQESGGDAAAMSLEDIAALCEEGAKSSDKKITMSSSDFAALWALGALLLANAEAPEPVSEAAPMSETAPEAAPAEDGAAASAAPAEPWNLSVAAEVRRADGNTDGTFTSLRAEANYIKAPWTVKFFANANYDETDGAASEHKISGGFDAGYGFNEHTGLYVRDELLNDRINDIKLRSTSAAGCELFAFKNAIPGDLEMFRLRLGLGHRYEKLRSSGGSDSDMTLDTGAKFRKRLNDAAIWDTELTWVPAFDEFGDYILTHETRLEINLSARWKLTQDFGVRHEYNAQPAAGTEKLDSTYFARVRKTW